MRVAFFGGSFDPPHCGHIAIAEAALRSLALDRVLVAPAGVQPLKAAAAHAGFPDRMAMVQLAVAGHGRLIASSLDAPRPDAKPNYTFDTLARLRGELDATDVLFCLLGADSLLTLRQWYRAAELLLFCDFIVAGRPGISFDRVATLLPSGILVRDEQRQAGLWRLDLEGAGGGRSSLFLLTDLDEEISATGVRRALAAGKELPGLLAPQVLEYIRAQGLYR